MRRRGRQKLRQRRFVSDEDHVPVKARFMTSAFSLPDTISKTRRARRMVPTPMVSACRGTSSSLSKNLRFAATVEAAKFTKWVSSGKDGPGSLNPIWPL